MKYRNKKTGVIIDVLSEMHGDWEPVQPAPNSAHETAKSTPEKTEKPVKKAVKSSGRAVRNSK